MIRRWIVNRAIDREVPLSPEELRACVDEVYEELHRDDGPALGIFFLMPSILTMIIGITYGILNGFSTGLIVIMGLVMFASFIGCAILIPIPMIRKRLRHKLHDRGVNICTQCGYWLRDLDSSTTKCPECGWGRGA